MHGGGRWRTRGLLVGALGVLRRAKPRPYTSVLASREMPGAEWLPGARLNYAEHMLGGERRPDMVAVLGHSQTRGAVAAHLRRAPRAGRPRPSRPAAARRQRGDRVVAYLPNIPETLVAFLATASLGAIWASVRARVRSAQRRSTGSRRSSPRCCSPSGYRYGDGRVDRRARSPRSARRCRRSSTSSRCRTATAVLPDASLGRAARRAGPARVRPGGVRPSAVRPVLLGHDRPAEGDRPRARRDPARAPEEPRASAGTSGRGDRLLWFTTTAWMMWNALVSRAAGAGVDRDARRQPGLAGPAQQWRVAEQTRPTLLGAARRS